MTFREKALAGASLVLLIIAGVTSYASRAAAPGNQKDIKIHMTGNNVCQLDNPKQAIDRSGYAVWESKDQHKYLVEFNSSDGTPFYASQFEVDPGQSSGPVTTAIQSACKGKSPACEYSYQVFVYDSSGNKTRCDEGPPPPTPGAPAPPAPATGASSTYIGIHINP